MTTAAAADGIDDGDVSEQGTEGGRTKPLGVMFPHTRTLETRKVDVEPTHTRKCRQQI